jgi:hypothetical protein
MDHRPTTLEKAFELARSGKCLSIREIGLSLRSGGYSLEQIQGPTLKKQLLELIEAANKPGSKRH